MFVPFLRQVFFVLAFHIHSLLIVWLELCSRSNSFHLAAFSMGKRRKHKRTRNKKFATSRNRKASSNSISTHSSSTSSSSSSCSSAEKKDDGFE